MSNIVIYGRGKTGDSLAKLLKEQRTDFTVYEDSPDYEGAVEFNENTLVIVSPGVKPTARGLVAAKKCGASIVGELEYCFRFCKGRCISVTGTNGKTTTCEMIAHVLHSYGINTYLLGNGGIPFSSKAAEIKKDDLVVLESSSFQLRGCKFFSPYVSVFTNLAPDHLDYHSDFKDYAEAKINNFIHQREGFGVFNFDDTNTRNLSSQCGVTPIFYSTQSNQAQCYYNDGRVYFNGALGNFIVDAQSLSSLARHNLSNALAAVSACLCVGVPLDYSIAALASYTFLPHRLQKVRTIGGVDFVDDSKATNVHATVSALNCFECRTALIVGGSYKGESFDGIFTSQNKHLVKIVATGDTAKIIADCGKRYNVRVDVADDIKDAVKICYEFLKNDGGVVLMSNACASYDKFSSYAARGEYFQKIVGAINED